MIIDEHITSFLARQLDEKMARNRVIASNVANVDTPGYKARDLSFAQALNESQNQLLLKVTQTQHLQGDAKNTSNGEVIESKTPGRPDGNNVDIDDEMLKLSKNNIEYNTAVQFMTKKMIMLRTALDDLRRS